MRSLFFRVFLWFGLAMILVNIASFATGIIAERRFQPPRGHPLAPMTGLVSQTAVETFELGGAAALTSYLTRLQNTSSVHATLLNERLEDVTVNRCKRMIRRSPGRSMTRCRSFLIFPMEDAVALRRMVFS
jgi:hypothetical protein